jgi:hypothetical protein
MAQDLTYQEETLLGLIAHKDMMRWYKKSHKALAQIEYIKKSKRVGVKRSTRYQDASWMTIWIDSKRKQNIGHN